MVCQQLNELEWDFVQARAESRDIDSLGQTDREFSCLVAILDHKRRGIKENPAFEISYHSEQNSPDSRPGRLISQLRAMQGVRSAFP